MPHWTMAISGLALLLSSDPDEKARAVGALTALSQLTLGPANGDRISAVLDTPDPHTDRLLVRKIQTLRGVLRVDLVCVFFDEETPDAATPEGAFE